MSVDTYALSSLTALKSYLNISVTTWDTLLEDCIDAASAIIERFIDRRIMSRTWMEIIDPRGSAHVVLREKPVTSVTMIGFGSRPCLSFSLDGTTGIIGASFEVVPSSGTSVASVTLRYYATSGSAASTLSSGEKSASALATDLSASPWVVSQIGDDVRTEFMHQSGAVDVTTGTGYATCPARFDAQSRVDLALGVVHRTSAWACGVDPEWDEEEWPEDWRPTFGVQPQSMTVMYTAGYATTPYDIELTCRKVAATLFRERVRDMGVSSESLGDYSYVNASNIGASAVQAILESDLKTWKRAR